MRQLICLGNQTSLMLVGLFPTKFAHVTLNHGVWHFFAGQKKNERPGWTFYGGIRSCFS